MRQSPKLVWPLLIASAVLAVVCWPDCSMQAGETNASAIVKTDSKSDSSQLRIKTLDGRTYEHVTIIGNIGGSLWVKYKGEGGSSGLAQIKYENLPADLYKKYNIPRPQAAPYDAGYLKSSLPTTSAANPTIDRSNAQSIMDDAIARVKQMVNQPARQLPRTSDMSWADFGPFWFHPGAITPDFNNVDIRATQEFTYDKYPYVTSQLNPNVVFIGSDLEFNSMTKYFYEDRSLPKKKLTEGEMLEINRLYRIIGKCQEKLK